MTYNVFSGTLNPSQPIQVYAYANHYWYYSKTETCWARSDQFKFSINWNVKVSTEIFAYAPTKTYRHDSSRHVLFVKERRFACNFAEIHLTQDYPRAINIVHRVASFHRCLKLAKGQTPRSICCGFVVERFVCCGLAADFIILLEAVGFSRILDSLSSAHRMHDFTDFRQPNFTKFERNTSIGVAMNLLGTEFLKFSHKGSFYQKNAKKWKFSTSCDFRPP